MPHRDEATDKRPDRHTGWHVMSALQVQIREISRSRITFVKHRITPPSAASRHGESFSIACQTNSICSCPVWLTASTRRLAAYGTSGILRQERSTTRQHKIRERRRSIGYYHFATYCEVYVQYHIQYDHHFRCHALSVTPLSIVFRLFGDACHPTVGLPLVHRRVCQWDDRHGVEICIDGALLRGAREAERCRQTTMCKMSS